MKRTKPTRARTRATDWKPKFLSVLKNCGVVKEACEKAGVDRTTAYEHKQTDPDFARDWQHALDAGTDMLEAEAIRRGREGVLEPVVQQGVPVFAYFTPDGKICQQDTPGAEMRPLYVRKYSDQLLTVLLKARRYSDKVEMTGKDGGPIQTTQKFDLSKLSVDELQALGSMVERATGEAPKEQSNA